MKTPHKLGGQKLTLVLKISPCCSYIRLGEAFFFFFIGNKILLIETSQCTKCAHDGNRITED